MLGGQSSQNVGDVTQEPNPYPNPKGLGFNPNLISILTLTLTLTRKQPQTIPFQHFYLKIDRTSNCLFPCYAFFKE